MITISKNEYLNFDKYYFEKIKIQNIESKNKYKYLINIYVLIIT